MSTERANDKTPTQNKGVLLYNFGVVSIAALMVAVALFSGLGLFSFFGLFFLAAIGVKSDVDNTIGKK